MGPRNRKTGGYADDRDDDPNHRYQSLMLRESLCNPSRYIFACKELSFLLKNAYSKFPKNLQSLVFQDTLFAFTVLPQAQTQSAISAANNVVQSAEFALPKQKRAICVKEYKNAVVASKRKSKTNLEGGGLGWIGVPEDIVVHIFSFLDVQSLVRASAVCRSWNGAATDQRLWKSLYRTYFSDDDDDRRDSRSAFKAAYKATKLKNYNRGYCWSCTSVVWLNANKCPNSRDHRMKPISMQQIVEFIVDGSVSSESSSESDSDTQEDASIFRLWAYPNPS